jgi:hypothetical protein
MHLFHCAPQYIIAIAWCIISVNGNANPIIQVSTADFVSQVEEVVEDKLRNVTSFNNLTRCSSTEVANNLILYMSLAIFENKLMIDFGDSLYMSAILK